MNLGEMDQPLNILVLHGPELQAAGLDPEDFSQALAGLPHCRVLPLDPALSPAAQEEQLRGFLGDGAPCRPVVVAAQDPEFRGAWLTRLLTREWHLNPEHLAQVDLTPALEQPDPETKLAKGLEMIRLAATHLQQAKPIAFQKVPVSRQVLVWGDSIAALNTARELAGAGHPVILATPRDDFAPLPLEAGEAMAPPISPEPLLKEVQEQRLIRMVRGARFKDLSGVAGNFLVRLDTAAGPLAETVGAVVLAPELERKAAPERYHPEPLPGMVSISELEKTLNQGGELPGVAALLVGAAGGGHPLALARALRAAARLLEAGSRVYLLVGQAKLAAPGLERAVRANQEAGMLFIKLRERPTLEVADQGLLVTFFDPTLGEELGLAVDLVVYDEVYQAAPENADLAALLRLPRGAGGFLQADNVHFVPVKTPRRGIYVAGPGRAPMNWTDTVADVDAAFQEIHQFLGQGEALVPQGRAWVDRGKCVLCLTCHRFCPHGAITWDNRAIINEVACQGCGICASQCPQEAIQLRNYTDEQVEAVLSALDTRLHPRVVAFLCRNSAWEAYEAALKQQVPALPAGFTPIRMPCAGKVDPEYVLKAFQAGADGVLVLACPEDNCKSAHGNLCAKWNVEQVQGLLAEAGIDPGRLVFQYVAANAPGDFLDAVDQLALNLSRAAAATEEAYPIWLTAATPVAATRRPEGRKAEEIILEISPEDAQQLGVNPGERVRTVSPRGSLVAATRINPRLRPGSAFVPRHFLREVLELLGPGATTAPGGAVQLAKLVEELEEVFGLKIPLGRYYHRGHAWVALEGGGMVRVGMDDFSQKLLGPGDAFALPEPGQEISREDKALTFFRGREKAPILAPFSGVVEAVNPKVLSRPEVAHHDPYGDGWLFMLAPTTPEPDLKKLVTGQESVAWIKDETERLVGMLDSSVGATLHAGGSLIDDVYGHYPDLGWANLVKEFLRSL
jgi:coenzyme F420-reducing hydrogenase delta subunit/glycine cleavage system H lipoate-binding protein/Pyruvate/2-oxoacid:ferredoxin oxidoreductase delta subunit